MKKTPFGGFGESKMLFGKRVGNKKRIEARRTNQEEQKIYNMLFYDQKRKYICIKNIYLCRYTFGFNRRMRMQRIGAARCYL